VHHSLLSHGDQQWDVLHSFRAKESFGKAKPTISLQKRPWTQNCENDHDKKLLSFKTYSPL